MKSLLTLFAQLVVTKKLKFAEGPKAFLTAEKPIGGPPLTSQLDKAVEALLEHPTINTKELIRRSGCSPKAVYTVKNKALSIIAKMKKDPLVSKSDNVIASKRVEIVKNGDYILIKVPISELSAILLASLLKTERPQYD